MRVPLQLLLVALLSGSTAFGFARFRCQRASQPEPARGSISGTVSIGGKPAPHITVVLILDNHDVPVVARAVTDEAGHFKFANLPSGRYLARVIAPTWVPVETTSLDSEGKRVSLRDGEALQSVDLSMVRAGVITGRVTDDNGLPLTYEEITLCRIPDDSSKPLCHRYSDLEFSTDDRGMYRIYGIPPGHYKVSVGKDRTEMGGLDSRGNFLRRFYPGTSNEDEAVPLEVTSDREAANIDIALSKPVTTYTVTGPMVYQETGQVYAPPDLHTPLDVQVVEGTSFVSSRFTRLWGISDGKGRFVVVGGLVPGKYCAAVRIEGEDAEIYGEPKAFEVTDHDIVDLELRVRRGSTVSGVIVPDRQVDQELISRKPGPLQISAIPYAGDSTSPDARKGPVNTDGSFRIPGLRPGKFRLALRGYVLPPIRIVRIEPIPAPFREGNLDATSNDRDNDAVDVPAGENVTGLRVVVQLGSGSISGPIKVVGGESEVTVSVDLTQKTKVKRK